uniref:Uncharacterized protein n=1 Tax=Pipistrellus kuhlii TaxID=59472 RepID=A0A7J7ZKN5_PIPKU|nr:hypothetical protein mPipKuh1_009503 [Pipistrellus kuhlii]
MIRKIKLESKRGQIGHKAVLFCNPVSKVTAHHFLYTLFSKSKSLGPAHSQLERIVHEHECQEAGITETHRRSCLPYSCLMSLQCTSLQLIGMTNMDFESIASNPSTSPFLCQKSIIANGPSFLTCSPQRYA